MSLLRAIGCFFLLTGVLFFGYSCKKNQRATPISSGVNSYNGVLTGTILVSATKVQLGQPLIATLQPTQVFPIRWSCSFIANMSHVTSANRQAMFLFEQPGFYTIEAATLGKDSVSVTDSSWIQVFVTDTVYQPAVAAQDTLSLTGDQVLLTPTLDSNANLILLAQTRNNYGCLSSIVYTMTSGSNGAGGLNIQLQQVVNNGPFNCHEIENPASAYLFPPSPTSGWANGNYPLSVSLNGVTYTGTLSITEGVYLFNWNYTSGVVFTQSLLKK